MILVLLGTIIFSGLVSEFLLFILKGIKEASDNRVFIECAINVKYISYVGVIIYVTCCRRRKSPGTLRTFSFLCTI